MGLAKHKQISKKLVAEREAKQIAQAVDAQLHRSQSTLLQFPHFPENLLRLSQLRAREESINHPGAFCGVSCVS